MTRPKDRRYLLHRSLRRWFVGCAKRWARHYQWAKPRPHRKRPCATIAFHRARLRVLEWLRAQCCWAAVARLETPQPSGCGIAISACVRSAHRIAPSLLAPRFAALRGTWRSLQRNHYEHWRRKRDAEQTDRRRGLRVGPIRHIQSHPAKWRLVPAAPWHPPPGCDNR